LGKLYEVEVNDHSACSTDTDIKERLSYNIVGCYVGDMPVGGRSFYIFSNVICEPDSHRGEKKDPTNGRRVFSRAFVNKDIILRKLVRG
jgi:hypothetical protein